MLDSAQGADQIGDILCFVSRAKIKNGDFHYKFSIRYRNRYSNITFDMQLSVLKRSSLLSVFTKSCALTQFNLCVNVRRKSVQLCLKHCKYCWIICDWQWIIEQFERKSPMFTYKFHSDSTGFIQLKIDSFGSLLNF